jgi:2',3'-cyclic-nucleotide 2'-phosphodiesterase (5'-nucleotidase family)
VQIGRIWIGGTEITDTGTYRVTMNNFLATGGDGFTLFNQGTDALGRAQDIDSFVRLPRGCRRHRRRRPAARPDRAQALRFPRAR